MTDTPFRYRPKICVWEITLACNAHCIHCGSVAGEPRADELGTDEAVVQNVAKEYERNAERYALLKWAQRSFDNFKVVPPRSGICHQVNLENLGQVVIAARQGAT